MLWPSILYPKVVMHRVSGNKDNSKPRPGDGVFSGAYLGRLDVG